MNNLKSLFRKPGFHSFLFCLCFVLFSWPILTIADRKQNITIFIYLFLIWGIIIFLLFLIAWSHHLRNVDEDENQKEE
ncbi:MAG: hypothetical protein JW786_12645 [Desulfobacterales bacterium]|nr:hypothetical protein [Desulfobacterales bacterium]